MTIRQARVEDFPAIHDLVKSAFATAKVSDGTEQDFVLELRRRESYLPEFELVAEENGVLTGHIMLTALDIPGAPEGFRGLMLAPLSVRLENRSRGLGAELIARAVQRARAQGWHALFLIGDPDYYRRAGFRSAAQFGFVNASGVEDKYLQALPLVPGALDHAKGALNLH